MNYEVEQKFRVTDMLTVEHALRRLGAQIEPPRLQVDCYFAHPARNFAKTDEALRVRRVGEQCYITYKGPKIDTVTKTRQEIELPIGGPDGSDQCVALLNALGFERVGEVRKLRRRAKTPWQQHTVEVALDEVGGVGDFVELELSADQHTLTDARHCVAALAKELNLTDGERRSYLQLLLGGPA